MGAPAASQARVSPSPSQNQTKDTVHKIRGGRLSKSTTKRLTTVEGRRLSQRIAVTVAKAPIPVEQSDRLSDVVNRSDKLGEKVAQVQQKGLCKRRQGKAKICHKPTRMSRRLQGLPPEVGVFSQQDAAALLTSAHLGLLQKGRRPILVEGSKPRGVTKSGHDGTNSSYRRRSKRLQSARESLWLYDYTVTKSEGASKSGSATDDKCTFRSLAK
jgi:hypothetical protein